MTTGAAALPSGAETGAINGPDSLPMNQTGANSSRGTARPTRHLHQVAALVFLVAGAGGASGTEPAPRFTDLTQQAGVAFRNWYGDSNAKTILETTGTGAGFCDYDDDGDLDLYIVNGAVGFDHPRLRDLPHDVQPPADGSTPRNALFRNNGDGTFIDATAEARVGHTGWGAGCVCGDYDNDGDRDLYVTYYGANVLYRNNGDGTFSDVSAKAGVDDGGYGQSAAFGDYDNDGYLDLYVANYLEFDPATTILPGERRGNFFGHMRGIPTMASPEAHDPSPDVLYRNNGDGTFTDVSAKAGINPQLGRGMGAVFWDYDDDGDQDIYVANDASANLLYTNNGDGTFDENGARMEVAFDADGSAEGSMGLASGDFDNDGRKDMVVTNFEVQTTTLHHNQGSYFADVSLESGVGLATIAPMQWGAILFDYDNDGDQDLYLASGHLTSALEDYYPQSSFAQKNQLFRNTGGSFEEVTNRAGDGLMVIKSSRGVASGDYDGDGDEDLFVVNKNDFPTLLRNDTQSSNHWLMLRTRGAPSNRDGIGAKVRVVSAGLAQVKEVRAGSSYLSHNSLGLAFGLGSEAVADTVEVRWPSGLVQRFTAVQGDRYLGVKEGGELVEGLP